MTTAVAISIISADAIYEPNTGTESQRNTITEITVSVLQIACYSGIKKPSDQTYLLYPTDRGKRRHKSSDARFN